MTAGQKKIALILVGNNLVCHGGAQKPGYLSG